MPHQDPTAKLELLEDIYDALEMLRESSLLTHALVFKLACLMVTHLEVCATRACSATLCAFN